MTESRPRYCVDTSALIDLWRGEYPHDIFVSLWGDFERMVTDGQTVAPREVRREIQAGRDDLVTWARANKPMFIDPDPNQVAFVQTIGARFKSAPSWLTKSPHADPWVVALAKDWQIAVLSAETYGTSETNPKIPFVCREFGVRSVSVLEFIREERLTY